MNPRRLIVIASVLSALLCAVGCSKAEDTADADTTASAGTVTVTPAANTSPIESPGAEPDVEQERPTRPSRPRPTADEIRRAQDSRQGPRIAFERIEHDYGEVWDIEETITTFKFSNVGTDTLVIDQIKPSCGCTTTQLEKMVYEPGESAEIEVKFKPKGRGNQVKRISVLSNSAVKPLISLSIKADVKPFVTVEPLALRFEAAEMGTVTKKIFSFSCADPNAIVHSVRPVGAIAQHVSVRFLPDNPDDVDNPNRNLAPESRFARMRRVEVTLKETAPWGVMYGGIDITVEGYTEPDTEPVTHTAKVTVFAQVFGQVMATDTMFRIGVTPPGEPFEHVIRLTHKDNKPFEITDALIQRGTVRMTSEVRPITENDQTGYEVIVRGDPGEYLGQLSGFLIVSTDIPGEERLTFRIAGFVREDNRSTPSRGTTTPNRQRSLIGSGRAAPGR